MFDNRNFGSRLRAYRKDLGLGLSKFATLVDIDYQYLGDIERGERTPSTKLVINCLNCLNTSYDEFMNNTNSETNLYISLINNKLANFSEKENKIILETLKEFKEALR